jgi:sugar fermentation stimulation protein A
MRFPAPLVRATLVRRYKRFLADMVLASGEETVAHCANTGSMLGLAEPGAECWLSPAANPERKLRWTWELVRSGDGLVGINTAHPNGIVGESIAAGAVPELAGYDLLRREVKYGKSSRIDILLTGGGRPDCYVEIKNVHLRRDCHAEFPDAATARGAKHLAELSAMVAQGRRAVMLYLVQREDCDRFRIAADIDPAYAAALAAARNSGVEALAYACKLSPDCIELHRPLEIARA